MTVKEKAKLLVDITQVNQIDQKLKKCKEIASSKGIPPDAQLFRDIQHRIYKILKTNYLDEFYSKVL